MFPPYLRKGIIQLDKQITVLENECQNMDLEKRKKKNTASQNRLNYCSKSLDIYEKPTGTRNFIKKNNECAKRIKKLSPASSSRVDSTSSAPSNCNKQSNKVSDVSNNKADKLHKVNDKTCHLCSCHTISNSNKSCTYFKQNKVKCNCENEYISSEECKAKIKSSNLNNITHDVKKDCVIHKEVLFSNPEGSIEVTVKQKANVKNQGVNNLRNESSCGETIKTDSCNCQCSKQQNFKSKWSEILALDCVKENKECKYENKKYDGSGDLTPISENCGNKLNKKPLTKNSGADNEKKVGDLLSNELDELGEQEKRKLLSAVNILANKIISQDTEKSSDANKYNVYSTYNSQNEIFQTIQKLCDNLIREKDFLTKEILAKNSIITNMKKREEEYNSLISMLKLNLGKAKLSSETNIGVVNELKKKKLKLLEQAKVIEALKKNNFNLKELLDKQILENDRLKTEIQIYKLECHKHDVVITGMEAEIKRYKEEIGNFQKQISEHLATLKTNSQAVDLKKMMEAIIQQSQIFVRDDLDAILVEEHSKESLQHNKLMHSSPTSTKTSDVNSSWKQISSIKTQEINSDLNNSEENEFYQVYGGDISLTSKNSLQKPISKLAEENVKKKTVSKSFVSCVSEKNEENEMANKENINNKTSQNKQKSVKNSPEKLKIGIDELLQGMKLKFSEEVFRMTKPDNGVIEDFLNSSLVSSIYD